MRMPTAAAAARSARQQQLLLPHAVEQSASVGTAEVVEPAASCSSSMHASLWSRLDWELLLLACALPAGPALAEEGVAYNATQGEGIVKTLSGVAYIGLLLYFLTKVLNRRARKAREERLAGQGPVTTVFTKLIEKATEGKPQPKVTPSAAFIGAAQAAVIAYGLFIFSSKVTNIIAVQDLPAGYTAANIATTVRTIIVGLVYLATFIFSANAVGLTGLGLQLLFFPDSLPDEDELLAPKIPKGPQLPKVSVTSSTDDIRRAFEAVSKGTGDSSSSSSSGAASSSSSTAATPVGAASGSGEGAAGSSTDSS